MTQSITDNRETNKMQDLNKKIILVTNSQRPYIQKILMKLSERNPENAESICDYILSDQICLISRSQLKKGK